LEEALPLFHGYGDVFKELMIHIELAGLALERDEVEHAASRAREGLLLLRDSGMRWPPNAGFSSRKPSHWSSPRAFRRSCSTKRAPSPSASHV
jgi:hypothetical protein